MKLRQFLQSEIFSSLKFSNFAGWKNSLEFLWWRYNSIPLCGTQLYILRPHRKALAVANSELTKLYSTYTIVPLQLHYCKDNGQLFLATIVCELRHYHAEATLRKKNNPHQKSSNVPFTYFPEKGERLGHREENRCLVPRFHDMKTQFWAVGSGLGWTVK